MALLLEYFNGDFRTPAIGADTDFFVEENGEKFTFKSSVKMSAENSTKLFTFYIPAHNETYDIVQSILVDLRPYKKIADQFNHTGGFKDDVHVGIDENVYARRIYFYTETQLNLDEIAKLGEIATDMRLLVTFRS